VPPGAARTPRTPVATPLNSFKTFCQDKAQDQDFIFFVLEAPRYQDLGLEEYVTGVITYVHAFVQQINSQSQCPGVGVKAEKGGRDDRGGLIGLILVLVIIALMLVIACVVWVVFAMRHPNSSAGQCLIQVRADAYEHLT